MADVQDFDEFNGEAGGFSWRALGVILLILTAFVLVFVAWIGMSGGSAAGGCGGG